MAKPQLENGYVKIANELFEQLVKASLLGAEIRIALFVIRKTYGFNKKVDYISLTQFKKGTNLSRPTVNKSLKNLISKNILLKVKESHFSINKDYETWTSKSVLTSKGVFTKTSKSVLTTTSKSVLTHKRHILNTKDNSTFSKEKDAPLKANNKNTMKNSFKYNDKQHSDNFEDSIDIDTGEFNKPKEPKRQKAINLVKNYFADKCEEKIKIRPVLTFKQNIIIANLFNKNKMKPSELKELIDWWFDTEQDKTKLIQINLCLSAYNINNFKVFKNL